MTGNRADDLNVWDDTLAPSAGAQGLYIAVSGNTACGKSTLIDTVVKRARAEDIAIVGIGERLLHHPYLRLMFADPNTFAFPIQVNFMLQRHLVLLRNLGLGRVVVIERSHLDDELFVREHVDAGTISPAQLEAYTALAGALHTRLRAPDVLVLMTGTPELSIARLRHAEKQGHRPREFPDEVTKERWVRRWHALYARLHDDYRRLCRTSDAFRHTSIIEHDASGSADGTVARILEHARTWRRCASAVGDVR